VSLTHAGGGDNDNGHDDTVVVAAAVAAAHVNNVDNNIFVLMLGPKVFWRNIPSSQLTFS